MPAYMPIRNRCVWLRPSVASMNAASPRWSGERSSGRNSFAANVAQPRCSAPVVRPSLAITLRKQRS